MSLYDTIFDIPSSHEKYRTMKVAPTCGVTLLIFWRLKNIYIYTVKILPQIVIDIIKEMPFDILDAKNRRKL